MLLIYCAYCCCRFREKVGLKIVKALKRDDDGVTHAAVDMLAALMQVSDASEGVNTFLVLCVVQQGQIL